MTNGSNDASRLLMNEERLKTHPPQLRGSPEIFSKGSSAKYVVNPSGSMASAVETSHGCCQNLFQCCKGFFTDREKRKIWGMGILYIFTFPICVLMMVVGGLKAAPPGEDNPDCSAEPNMPWFLVIGGAGITFLLIVRIILTKCVRCLKENPRCCDEVTGCFCEFSCNILYDLILVILIVLWMIPVTWWVFRHRLADHLYQILGQENLDSFRMSMGDNDTIHDIQFTEPELDSYCDRLLYVVTFVVLSTGWIIFVVASLVLFIGKVCYSVLCCRLCRNIEGRQIGGDTGSEATFPVSSHRPDTGHIVVDPGAGHPEYSRHV